MIYGGYLGLRFENFLPNMQCPNNDSYSGGGCYLMPLLRNQYGIKMDPNSESGMMPFTGYIVLWGRSWAYLRLLIALFVFVILFNKSWCGWMCPFGTIQDIMTFMRNKFSIRETLFSEQTKQKLKVIRYLLLYLFLAVYILLIFNITYPNMEPFYCRICPAKAFLPPFEHNFLNIAVDFTVGLGRFLTSIAAVIILGFITVEIFFVRRFFCVLCPVGAFLDTFNKPSLLKITKNANRCTRCGNCWRMCPMDIKEVYLEEENGNVIKEKCILCLKCIEACPQDKALSLQYKGLNIFSSSKKYFSKWFGARSKL